MSEMTSKVIIKILVSQSHEIPTGIYHHEEFIISDLQWQNMRSALTEFEVELMSMAPQSLTSSMINEEKE